MLDLGLVRSFSISESTTAQPFFLLEGSVLSGVLDLLKFGLP